MRILHTSDWHLGKRLFKLDRSEEHALFLDWLIKTIKEQNIDVLLIAGDIFDTPTPPHQALETFYNFLHRMSVETTTETLIIAGNHDSGLLLEAPSKILAPHRVKVWGKLSEKQDEHWYKIGNVDLCAIPFFRSYELLPQGEGDVLEALKSYLVRDKKGPQLLMLHHLAGKFELTGSEQVINLSGVDSIPTDVLNSFDYVALGHIHKPQKISSSIFYSGSPIPLRFSETIRKSVMIIEEKEGKLESSSFPIPAFRELITIRTDENDYRKDIEGLQIESHLRPMAEVQISLSAPRIGLVDEIKNLLEEKGLELLSYMPLYEAKEKKERRSEKLFELSPLELFQEFYKTKYKDAGEVPEDLKSDFSELLEKVKHASRSP